MVKALTYDIPDHKIKLKIRQFQVMGKNTRQINNTGYDGTPVANQCNHQVLQVE